MNKSITVMTYNIQHGLDYVLRINNDIREVNLKKISDIINKYNPDIISLNEVYNTSSNSNLVNQVGKIAKFADYPYFYFGKAIEYKNQDYGNAIISKYPFININTINIPDSLFKDKRFESRSIIEADLGFLRVLVSHFGLSCAEQDNATNTIIELINKNKSNVIFMGDLNMEDDNYNIQKISNYLKNVKVEEKTFPSINPKIKIDYIFISEDIELVNSKVLLDIASDHLAILADIKIHD